MRGMGMGAGMAPARRRRGGRFTPLSLFSAGEQGYWLDPSDFSTMFQDTAGATPVTAFGQSVRLMLDKSRGLVLGPELVTNGKFDADVSGWSAGNSALLNWVNGKIQIERNGVNNPFASQSFATVVGKTYRIEYTLAEITGASAGVRVGTSAGNDANSNTGAISVGTGSRLFVATATTTHVSLFLGATTDGVYVQFDNISVREVPGNHFTQTSTSNAPILQQDASGRYFLLFDGTDDWLQSGTITPGTDKVQVFAGIRKNSDAATFVALENTTANGTLRIFNLSGTPGWTFGSQGTTSRDAGSSGTYAAPITNVLTGLGDIAGDLAQIRLNGVLAGSNLGDQGPGNYLAYPHYIGRRGGTTLPFNGRIYQLICRFGPNLTAAQIQQVETFVNQRTGAY